MKAALTHLPRVKNYKTDASSHNDNCSTSIIDGHDTIEDAVRQGWLSLDDAEKWEATARHYLSVALAERVWNGIALPKVILMPQNVTVLPATDSLNANAVDGGLSKRHFRNGVLAMVTRHRPEFLVLTAETVVTKGEEWLVATVQTDDFTVTASYDLTLRRPIKVLFARGHSGGCFGNLLGVGTASRPTPTPQAVLATRLFDDFIHTVSAGRCYVINPCEPSFYGF